MRHYKKGRKLGTDASHTKAMKRSLVRALFLNDRIKTIESRAKEIRPDVDRIITWAKKGDLHSRRLAIAALGNDKDLVYEIFTKVDSGMFAGRDGGYTRIMKLGNRKGDNAPMVIMELVREPVAKKEAKAADKKAETKAAPKKIEAAEEEVAEEAKADEAEETVEATEEATEAEAPAEETAEAEEEKKAE
jgi:large subunit ribosomal protein L17